MVCSICIPKTKHCLAAQLIFGFILVDANNRFLMTRLIHKELQVYYGLCVLIIIDLNIAVDSQHRYYYNPFYLIKKNKCHTSLQKLPKSHLMEHVQKLTRTIVQNDINVHASHIIYLDVYYRLRQKLSINATLLYKIADSFTAKGFTMWRKHNQPKLVE